MKKLLKVGNALICLLLAVVFIFSAYAFFDRKTESVQENRRLARQPSLTAQSWFFGGYGRELEEFLSDHVLLREELIEGVHAVERAMRLDIGPRIGR